MHVPSNDQNLAMALYRGAKKLVYALLGQEGGQWQTPTSHTSRAMIGRGFQ
jgi:hypothetical protein